MLRLLIFILVSLCGTSTFASHFRYGNISWEDKGANSIEFTVETAWRRSFSSWNGINVGGNFTPVGFSFGDGSSISPIFTATAIDVNEDWVLGVSVFTHTYTSTGDFTAFFESCCRISGLEFNSGGNFRVESIVNVGSGNNPPESTLPPIIFLQHNLNNVNFSIPAIDPDGDILNFRLATPQEATGGSVYVQPPGLTVNNLTGLVSWSTVGYNIGDKISVTFAIEDLDANNAVKSKIMIDALLEIVGGLTPPYFTTPTPTNGISYDIIPGQNLIFTVNAEDNEPLGSTGGNIILNAIGLPPSAILTPSLPTNPNNPVTTTFSWTPTSTEGGTYLIVFTATDDQNLQTTTSIIINVIVEPRFNVPPSPGDGSYYCIQPGDSFNELYEVCDPEIGDTITLIAQIPISPPITSPPPPSVPGGLFIKDTLPTSLIFTPDLILTDTSCLQTTYQGNIAEEDWGIYPIEFIASDLLNRADTLRTIIIVNQPPFFTHVPADTVTIFVNSSLNITYTAEDYDAIYGDSVAFADPSNLYVDVPSWINFYDNGLGTLDLSATPTSNELGFHNIKIELHDRTTHFLHTHCSWQFHEFVLNVVESQFSCNNTTTYLDFNGTSTLDTSGLLSYQILPDTVYLSRTDFNCNDINQSPILDSAIFIHLSDTTICTFEVTVLDTIPPTATCEDITTYLDSFGLVTVSPIDIPYTTDDNCAANLIRVFEDDYDCNSLGDNQATFETIDASGNTGQCPLTITVVDSFPPFTDCRDLTIYLDDLGFYFLTPDNIDSITHLTYDNCTIDSIGISQESYSCDDMPSTIATLTFKDQSGNISTCDVIITVLDTISPDITCQDFTVDLRSNLEVTISPSQAILTASDNCLIDTTYFDQNSFSCLEVNSTTLVILTAADSTGNTTTCPVNVTVTDTHGYCCPDTLSVNYNPIDEIDYYASDSIHSNGGIANGTTINFRSPIVKMDAIFQVDMGALFQVLNEDCIDTTQCQSPDLDALIAIYNATGGPNWTNNTGWANGALGLDCDVCNWYGIDCNIDGRVSRIDMDGQPDNIPHGGNGGNNLQGSIPTEIGNLTQLEILIFNDNPGLTSSIPSEIENLSQLFRLHMTNCNISGPLPEELGTLSSLNFLQLSGNNIDGMIPSSFGQLDTIQGIWIHDNNLEGNIPPSFANLSNLSSLWVENNDLSGCFDDALLGLCGQVTNYRIDTGNNFDISWDDFCNGTSCGSGPCDLVLSSTLPTSITRPHGATTDGNYYYLTNPSNNIDKVDLNGNLVATFGSSSVFSFNSPQGIVYADGKLYIGDNGNDRIAVYDTTGTHITDFTGEELAQPRMVYLYQNTLFVAQWFGGIIRYDLNGNVISSFGTGSGFLNGLSVHDDKVYVSVGQDKVNVYNLSGSLLNTITHSGNFALGIEIFENQIVLSDPNNGQILIYDLDGIFIKTLTPINGWALINETNRLALFNFSEIQYYSCD